MSEAQLAMAEAERDALVEELAALEKAEAPEDSAAALIKTLSGRTDPLQQENEWTQPIGTGGCCNVM
ncbi:MAG: hypothetical protein MHM6MM_007798 [Cercozoa sp. M6MM]